MSMYYVSDSMLISLHSLIPIEDLKAREASNFFKFKK